MKAKLKADGGRRRPPRPDHGLVDDRSAIELNRKTRLSTMFDRVVSVCSYFMVILSVVAFAMGAWWTLIGRISSGDGVFMLAGWCVCAVVFLYRAIDPAHLDAISIIKAR